MRQIKGKETHDRSVRDGPVRQRCGDVDGQTRRALTDGDKVVDVGQLCERQRQRVSSCKKGGEQDGTHRRSIGKLSEGGRARLERDQDGD